MPRIQSQPSPRVAPAKRPDLASDIKAVVELKLKEMPSTPEGLRSLRHEALKTFSTHSQRASEAFVYAYESRQHLRPEVVAAKAQFEFLGKTFAAAEKTIAGPTGEARYLRALATLSAVATEQHIFDFDLRKTLGMSLAPAQSGWRPAAPRVAQPSPHLQPPAIVGDID